jgi:uncharacterized protein YllA (UPF0747 family)
MSDPIWIRLRRVLDRNPDSTKVELSRASAEEMLHEIDRLKAEVERKDAALERIDRKTRERKPRHLCRGK